MGELGTAHPTYLLEGFSGTQLDSQKGGTIKLTSQLRKFWPHSLAVLVHIVRNFDHHYQVVSLAAGVDLMPRPRVRRNPAKVVRFFAPRPHGLTRKASHRLSKQKVEKRYAHTSHSIRFLRALFDQIASNITRTDFI